MCALRALLAVALALAHSPCRAADPLSAGRGEERAWFARLWLERLRLPAAGEYVSLAEVAVLRDLLPGLRAGPALLGALEGARGGLFVAGLAARWQVGSGEGLGLEGGLLLGAGGGHSAPVGGGLVLRPHLAVTLGLPRDRVSLGLAYMTFPSGDIHDGHLFLAWERRSGEAAGAGRGVSPGALAATVARWWRGGSAAGSAPGSARPLDLAGSSVAFDLAGPWALRLDAAGAWGGGSAGYMEVLGGPAVRVAVDPSGRLAVRGALLAGSGGGGGVATGGGLLARALAGVEVRPVTALTAALEAGITVAPTGSLRAGLVQATLGWALDTGGGDVPPLRWRLRTGVQRYGSSQRVTGTGRGQPVGLLVQRGDVLLRDWCYLTAQSGWAATGGAGGWATGLLGIGVETPAWARQRLALEALAGAGGGGGISSGGGAIVQVSAAWSADLSERVAVQLSAGRARAPRGRFDATVLDAGLVFRAARAR